MGIANWSLKYKILVLLTAVPAVLLGVYLFVALGVFSEDKLAYVFESSATVSKTLSSQASLSLESSLHLVKPALQEAVTLGSFQKLSKGLIQVESPLKWIAQFEPDKGSYRVTSFVEREDKEFESSWKEVQQRVSLVEAWKNSSRVVLSPYLDERILVLEKIHFPAESGRAEKDYWFAYLYEADQLKRAFQEPGPTENFFDRFERVCFVWCQTMAGASAHGNKRFVFSQVRE